NELPGSYKRYLMNYYRKSLEMMGTPIRIQFQNSENPFETKKEKLTISQQRQRKRLASMIKDRNK
ncbi:ribosome biogenesis GTPase Der, partial [Photobacterium damselae subsp. damselae]|nr:ribosome biogenesis GTPase Der [Photobacterium damselae subsp. damselae]NVP01970.1 ribosome biogenesis GTPase Der [Photobacterium damselae subsp. damselae]